MMNGQGARLFLQNSRDWICILKIKDVGGKRRGERKQIPNGIDLLTPIPSIYKKLPQFPQLGST